MVFVQVCIIAALAISTSVANPTAKSASSFWKGTPLDSSVEEMRSMCANEDAISCIKYKFMSFLDSVFQKDSYKLSENVEIVQNEYRANEVNSRGEHNFEDKIKQYIQNHDVTFKLPITGSSITVGARNLDQDEIDLKLKFSEGNVQEARKSKLKKIIVPILVFVLLKAITLIPLALGVLGLKAWNALQLSFFSFVISVALAVFQLCKKIAADNTPPAISAHGPWEAAAYNHYAARSFQQTPQVENAQQMAYNAYY